MLCLKLNLKLNFQKIIKLIYLRKSWNIWVNIFVRKNRINGSFELKRIFICFVRYHVFKPKCNRRILLVLLYNSSKGFEIYITFLYNSCYRYIYHNVILHSSYIIQFPDSIAVAIVKWYSNIKHSVVIKYEQFNFHVILFIIIWQY